MSWFVDITIGLDLLISDRVRCVEKVIGCVIRLQGGYVVMTGYIDRFCDKKILQGCQ